MKPILIAAALALSPLQVLAQEAAPPPENALTYLKQAGAALKNDDKILAATTEAQSKQIVAENAAVFPLLERAATLPLRSGMDSSAVAYVSVVTGNEVTKMSRLLTLRAELQQKASDSVGALRSGLLCVALALKVQEDGGLLVASSGGVGEILGLRSIKKLAPQWDAATLKVAARELAQTEAKRAPFGLMLASEREMQMEGWHAAFRGQALADRGYDAATQEKLIAALQESVDEQDALLLRPYALTQDIRPKPEEPGADGENAAQRFRPQDLPEVFPVVDAKFDARAWAQSWYKISQEIKYNLLFFHTLGQAQSAVMQAALAARAYRLEHGAFPKSLQVLVPEYLPAVPNDAFEVGAPLQLKDDADGFRIYSIGPDGFNDGGQAPEERGVKIHSQGDILAPTELLTF